MTKAGSSLQLPLTKGIAGFVFHRLTIVKNLANRHANSKERTKFWWPPKMVLCLKQRKVLVSEPGQKLAAALGLQHCRLYLLDDFAVESWHLFCLHGGQLHLKQGLL